MYKIFTLVLLLFFNSHSLFASLLQIPDHYAKTTQHQSSTRTPQEYFEVTHPLPSDELTPSCTHQIINHSFANTINGPPFTTLYSPPSDPYCPFPWSHVVLELHATCQGDQYDRIAAIWLGGVELLRTSTAEPTESGIFWKVRKDVTRYSSLFVERNDELTMMLENVVNDVYTGVYHVSVSLLFYNHYGVEVKVPSSVIDDRILRRELGGFGVKSYDVGDGGLYEKPADLVVPISDDGDRGCWFRIESESDVRYRKVRVPRNTRRVVVELYVSFHGDDEFWYSNPPNEYIEINNLTTRRGNGAYREVFIMIDGKFVASEVPFPVVFTGGINPLFWEPVVAIGAFNLPSYDFDLSPFLGVLLDGEDHEFGIGVANGISYWLVDANLHIWLDDESKHVNAVVTEYQDPIVCEKRESEFNKLDGSFMVEVKKKAHYSGWIQYNAGVFTTTVMLKYKFKSWITFQNNGAYKLVEQKVKTEKEVMILSASGELISHRIVKRKYPLNVITLTVPGFGKDTSLIVTNVSHKFQENVSGDFTKTIDNSQESGGWMEVKDHYVLFGVANTQQSFEYEDDFGCYMRTVAASNGRVTSDVSSHCC